MGVWRQFVLHHRIENEAITNNIAVTTRLKTSKLAASAAILMPFSLNMWDA